MTNSKTISRNVNTTENGTQVDAIRGIVSRDIHPSFVEAEIPARLSSVSRTGMRLYSKPPES